MQIFDASSIIYAWDNYPSTIFEPLWDWMGGLVTNEEIAMSAVALDEVKHNSPECLEWLSTRGVKSLPVSSAILASAQVSKGLIGVTNDNYHPEGVDEKDLIIIATAKAHGVPLVSNENVQTSLPKNMKKYKIPAVCQLGPVAVSCCAYLKFLTDKNPKF